MAVFQTQYIQSKASEKCLTLVKRAIAGRRRSTTYSLTMLKCENGTSYQQWSFGESMPNLEPPTTITPAISYIIYNDDYDGMSIGL